ncbi:transposase [Chryseobacterium gossypii]|uniref:transposase n=1 Tax=Chryseobacterium gossypii TaxID=3231602 RepID=UPI00352637B3
MVDLKNIHIGKYIKIKWQEMDVTMERTCNFFKLDSENIEKMFRQSSLDSDILLKWSKLLEYDFFRLYSQHLIFYSPPAGTDYNMVSKRKQESLLPVFKKNLYTREVIAFIMEQLKTGKKTRQQVINEYKIPKTTLYKWINKFSDQ